MKYIRILIIYYFIAQERLIQKNQERILAKLAGYVMFLALKSKIFAFLYDLDHKKLGSLKISSILAEANKKSHP
jgi:hypothetical protein